MAKKKTKHRSERSTFKQALSHLARFKSRNKQSEPKYRTVLVGAMNAAQTIDDLKQLVPYVNGTEVLVLGLVEAAYCMRP